MARLTGLQFLIAAAILHIQASNAAVIRNLETTVIPETTPQVSTMADSTIPQDVIAQTTLPPILFRTVADTATDIVTDRTESTDNPTTPEFQPELSGQPSRAEPEQGWRSTVADTDPVTATDSDTDRTEPTDNPTTPEVQPELSGQLLSRAEPELGWKSTVADTDPVTATDSDTDRTEPTDNPTTPEVQPELSGQLLSRAEPELGWKSTMADTSPLGSNATLVPTTQLVHVSSSLPEVGEPAVDHLVKIPSKVTTAEPERVTQTTTAPETANIPSKVRLSAVETVRAPQSNTKILQEKAVTISTSGAPSIPRKVQDTLPIPEGVTDSFVPPTVEIMGYVIDALWEKAHKNLDDGYKVSEDVNDTKDDWEDDDMSKPVFQTNVPIVNSESVPMRMHMDIVPQGFPEDLEQPIYYPDYYNDKDTRNDLEKFTDHPWGTDTGFDDPQDEVSANVDRYVTIQQQMRFFRYSDTFDKLVELHRDLAVYAKNRDIKMHKGFSNRVTDVLRESAATAASQLKTVISMISTEIDDESLDNNLKKFIENLSESNSESSLVLSSLPALHYS